MTVEPPKISVIIPVYNGERYLAAAVQSVLSQDVIPDAIVVVDDGSTDGTADLVQDIGEQSGVTIRYAYQANRGPAAARNHGLRLVRGELIAFHDADDLWAADKLARQLEVLEQEPKADVALGYTLIFQDEPGDIPREMLQWIGRAMLVQLFQSSLIRRSLLDRIGGLDESLRTGEDTDWFLRAREAGAEIRTHSDVVLLHRRHAHNTTNQLDSVHADFLKNLHRSVLRRRMARELRVGQGSQRTERLG